MSTIPESDYAGAIITFLNRDDGTKKAMTYPITRIVLLDERAQVQRTFVVQDGKWIEEQ